MLRALEIFWLSLTIFCLVAIGYAAYQGSYSEILVLLLCTVVAAFMYYLRRKQRIKASGK